MTLRSNYGISLLAILIMSACQSADPVASTQPSTLFSSPWNSGIDKSEPKFHVQKIDSNTVVFRQSLRATSEAPFLYLIFGDNRALLIDTGVEGGDIRSEVDRQIDSWQLANGRQNIALTVMHSHGHGDHIGGDSGFEGRPDTKIVGHEPEAVAEFFDIDDWPTGSAIYDLGGRALEVLPTPGHHPAHVMVFDPATRILFTGDTIYPGRLYFKCGKLDEISTSINKVANFARANDVEWFLGGHIEMMTTPGSTFPQNKKPRKGEHLLELPVSIIDEIQAGLTDLSHKLVITEYDEFVLLPHPADPRGKKPPNWCLPQD